MGTALDVTVLLHLPCMRSFGFSRQYICELYEFAAIDKTSGDRCPVDKAVDVKQVGDEYDFTFSVSNRYRLGLTEVSIANLVYDAVKVLLDREMQVKSEMTPLGTIQSTEILECEWIATPEMSLV